VFVYGYDSAGLGHNGIYNIPNTPQQIAYANVASQNISNTLQSTNVNAYFKPNCYVHTIEMNSNWNRLEVNGKNYPEVLFAWTVNPTSPQFRVFDSCVGANCNPTCRNL